MFRVNVCAHATLLLRFCNDLQRQSRLAGSFRAIDFDYPAARHTANSERNIESERTGGDGRNVFDDATLAEFHNRAFAELLLNLTDREVKGFLSIYVHENPPPCVIQSML